MRSRGCAHVCKHKRTSGEVLCLHHRGGLTPLSQGLFRRPVQSATTSGAPATKGRAARAAEWQAFAQKSQAPRRPGVSSGASRLSLGHGSQARVAHALPCACKNVCMDAIWGGAQRVCLDAKAGSMMRRACPAVASPLTHHTGPPCRQPHP